MTPAASIHQRHDRSILAPFRLANRAHGFAIFIEEHGHAVDRMDYVHGATLFIVADIFAKHTELSSRGLVQTTQARGWRVNGGRLCRLTISPSSRAQCIAIGELQTVAMTRS